MCGHLYIFRAPSQTEKCSSATSCTSTQFSARGTWVWSVTQTASGAVPVRCSVQKDHMKSDVSQRSRSLNKK
jgi:hypothetical protein